MPAPATRTLNLFCAFGVGSEAAPSVAWEAASEGAEVGRSRSEELARQPGLEVDLSFCGLRVLEGRAKLTEETLLQKERAGEEEEEVRPSRAICMLADRIAMAESRQSQVADLNAEKGYGAQCSYSMQRTARTFTCFSL